MAPQKAHVIHIFHRAIIKLCLFIVYRLMLNVSNILKVFNSYCSITTLLLPRAKFCTKYCIVSVTATWPITLFTIRKPFVSSHHIAPLFVWIFLLGLVRQARRVPGLRFNCIRFWAPPIYLHAVVSDSLLRGSDLFDAASPTTCASKPDQRSSMLACRMLGAVRG